MEIPSTEEVSRTIKKDGKLVISAENAGYLREVIYKINNPKLPEIVLEKVYTELGRTWLMTSLRGGDPG